MRATISIEHIVVSFSIFCRMEFFQVTAKVLRCFRQNRNNPCLVCNMHSVFYHGTIEWRLFNSTLHAGEAKANIILAMAISAQGINQKYTQFRKTPIGDNPAFTFRTFLLRLGLIGPEYKNVRMHLLKNLPGDKAWRHDKSLYPSNQPRSRTGETR